MATHVKFHEDQDGNLVEIDYYCSGWCFEEGTGEQAYGHRYPAPAWPDYAVYCETCGTLMHEGSVA